MTIVMPLALAHPPSAALVAEAEAAKVLPTLSKAGNIDSAVPAHDIRRLAAKLPGIEGSFTSQPTPAADK